MMWIDFRGFKQGVQGGNFRRISLSLHNVYYTAFWDVSISTWANLTRGFSDVHHESKNSLRDAHKEFFCVWWVLSGFKQDQRRKRKPACKDKTNNPKKVFVHTVFQVVQAAFHVIQAVFDAGQSLGDLLN